MDKVGQRAELSGETIQRREEWIRGSPGLRARPLVLRAVLRNRC